MSLASVALQRSDLDRIHDHLTSHMPAYRNMHLREARTRNKRRELRYLHAMYAPLSPNKLIEGAISGPGVNWRYRLTQTRAGVQVSVLSERASPKDLERIERQFLKEILARIDEEQSGKQFYPSRLPGQCYLKRSRPGMPATHPNCASAVADGVLDQAFVAQLVPWNFLLLRP